MKIILRFIHDSTINYGYILLRFPPNMHLLLFLVEVLAIVQTMSHEYYLEPTKLYLIFLRRCMIKEIKLSQLFVVIITVDLTLSVE
jgi:ABC-type xylose transport system permease subunit